MNRQHGPARRAGAGFTLLAVALLAPRAVQADTTYQIRAIARQGDTIGPVTIASRASFTIGPLNDRGQLTFATDTVASTGALILYTDGHLLPIAYAGGDAPGGTWPTGNFGVSAPVSMNQLGNVVFSAFGVFGSTSLGTFVWESDARKITPIALKGQPATNDLKFVDAGGYVPVINNFGEIAFPAIVKKGAREPGQGIFFLGRDGKLLPVALSDQDLPDGHKIVAVGDITGFSSPMSINDAGSVAFLVLRQGETTFSAYLWDKGPITLLAAARSDVGGGAALADVHRVWLNNSSRSVLLAAPLKRSAAAGLFRFAEGKLTAVLLPGQEMPSGGKFQRLARINSPYFYSVSAANDAGDQAFTARLEDGTTGAYLLKPDGTVLLLLKPGATTELGTITHVGDVGTNAISSGIGLNNLGQVAVVVRIDNGPAMIVLLTPVAQ